LTCDNRWRSLTAHSHTFLACLAAASFPFPGGEIEQASEQAGEQGSAPGVSKKSGRSGEGRARRGRGWEEKGIRSPLFLPLLLLFQIRSQFRSVRLLFWKRLLCRLYVLFESENKKKRLFKECQK